MAQVKACIQPELNFYQQKFSVQFRTVRAFKVARLCCPIQVKNLNPTAASVEEFRNFPFLDNDNIITKLSRELPDYLAAADGVVMVAGVMKKLSVIQPTSASAERVFGFLKNAFDDQQDNAVEDYFKGSVTIRYNNAKRL